MLDDFTLGMGQYNLLDFRMLAVPRYSSDVWKRADEQSHIRDVIADLLRVYNHSTPVRITVEWGDD